MRLARQNQGPPSMRAFSRDLAAQSIADLQIVSHSRETAAILASLAISQSSALDMAVLPPAIEWRLIPMLRGPSNHHRAVRKKTRISRPNHRGPDVSHIPRIIDVTIGDVGAGAGLVESTTKARLVKTLLTSLPPFLLLSAKQQILAD